MGNNSCNLDSPLEQVATHFPAFITRAGDLECLWQGILFDTSGSLEGDIIRL